MSVMEREKRESERQIEHKKLEMRKNSCVLVLIINSVRLHI